MTLPFGAMPNAQGGPPQGGQGQQFGNGQGLPQQQGGYVPQQQQQQFQPQPQQQQPLFVPPTHHMPNSDAMTLPAPYFPPPPQQQPNGFPAPQQQPHQQQGGFAQQLGYGPPQQQQQQGGWQQMPIPPQQQPQAFQQQLQAPPQQQQQQRQAPSGAIQQDHLGRLWGPGLPANLQGATMQQVQQALGLQQPQQQQRLQPQQMFQQPQQPQQQQHQTPTQQGQIQADAQPKSFWADPEGAIERVVERRLAPLTQTSQIQAVQSARDAVANQFPEFVQYEQDVIARMQGLDPQLLGNPQAWKIAFEQAVGERYLAQLRGGGGFRQLGNGQPNGSNGFQQMGPLQAGWQPYQQQNVQGPRLGDFFTESPSAGYQGMDGGFGQQQATQLTPQQREVARRFGMTEQQYAQGMGARY